MDIGTTLPTGCTDEYAVAPGAIRTWAKAADDAGFAGLWTLDHIVKPDTYVTSVLHPLLALSHAAAVTDDVPLGTSILLLPVRGTANTADAALTLRYLADREITLGLGAGYVPEEFEVTGVPMEERGPRLSEGIEALKALFSGEGTFDGRFHSFEDITIDPVVDDPPRILAGGASIYSEAGFTEPMLDRIVEADGWIAPPMSPEQAADDWETIRSHAESRGTDPGDIDRVLLNYTHVADTDDRERAYDEQRRVFSEFFSPDRGFEHAREGCLVGTPEDIRARLDAYAEIGFDQVIAGPAAHDADDLTEQMDRIVEHVLEPYS